MKKDLEEEEPKMITYGCLANSWPGPHHAHSSPDHQACGQSLEILL